MRVAELVLKAVGIRPKYPIQFGHYTLKIFQYETFVKHRHWCGLKTALGTRG